MSPRGRWVLGVAAAVAVAHAVAAFAQAGPVAVPDVPGYLSVAQWVAGGQPPPPFGYHPGYGLLLAPVASFGVSPDSLHTAALLLNGMVAAAVVLLAVALLRAIDPDAGRPALVVVAVVAALHPSVSVAAQIAWPETLLVALVMGCALLAIHLGREHRSRGCATAVALGALSATSVVLHPRAAALSVGVVAVLVVTRPARRRVLEVAAGAGVGAAVTAAAMAWAYTGPGGGDRVGTLVDAEHGGVGAAGAMAGQLVALAGGTAGIAVAGLVAAVGAVAAAPRSESPREDRAAAAAGAFLLVATVVAVVGSGASLAGSDRADTFAYGRYLDPYAIALVVFAVASGALRRRWALISALAIVLIAASVVAIGIEDGLRPPLRIMVLATDPLWQLAGGRVGVVVLAAVALTALVLGSALASSLDGRGRPLALLVGGGVVVVLVGVATVTGQRHVMAVGEVAAGQATGAALVADRTAADGCLAHDRAGVPSYAMWLYRLRLPGLEHRRVSLGDDDVPCSDLVVASTREAHRPDCDGAELLVDEPQGSWGVWSISACMVRG